MHSLSTSVLVRFSKVDVEFVDWSLHRTIHRAKLGLNKAFNLTRN